MYLGFSISYSVTQEEWEKVYEESLFLAQQLNLADWERFYYKGVRSYAYCKVKEQTDKRFSKEEHFWLTCGEYDHITNGDYFRMEKELNIYKYNEKAGPGIIIAINSNTNSMSNQFEDQVISHGLTILDYAYFIRLLAILCFMESELKEKIYIYGNISKRNCEDAVKFANQYLKKKIELPAQCDCNRLYEIVKKLEIPDYKKIHLMEKAYAGEIDLKYKRFIEEKFDKKAIKEFWKNRFKDRAVGDYEFEKVLKAYLSYGFDFKDLFSYITFTNEKEEYLKILELIIEIETNVNKISRALGITRNPEDNKVRGFTQEFRYSLFGPETDLTRYTFDEYVYKLSNYFAPQIDVQSFLKEKIKDEDDESFILRVRKYVDEDKYLVFKGEEKFDIIFANELINYKPGDKIAPYLMKEIKTAVKSNRKRLADKEFKEIQEKEPTEQIYELIDIYSHFPVRDIDWHHAIDYFNSHSDALKRYYPLFRMKFDYFLSDRSIAKALFINDDFYEFCEGIK